MMFFVCILSIYSIYILKDLIMEQQYIDSKSAFIGFFKGSFFLVFLYTLFFNQFTFYLVYNTPLNQNIFSYFLDFVIIFFGLLSLLPSKKILSILKQNEFDLNKNILYKYYIQGILFVNFLGDSLVDPAACKIGNG
jgi:hypothetical protein